MHLDVIKEYCRQAAEAERFWHGVWADSENVKDRNAFGLLWQQYRQLREYVEEIIKEREQPERYERETKDAVKRTVEIYESVTRGEE